MTPSICFCDAVSPSTWASLLRPQENRSCLAACAAMPYDLPVTSLATSSGRLTSIRQEGTRSNTAFFFAYLRYKPSRRRAILSHRSASTGQDDNCPALSVELAAWTRTDKPVQTHRFCAPPVVRITENLCCSDAHNFPAAQIHRSTCECTTLSPERMASDVPGPKHFQRTSSLALLNSCKPCLACPQNRVYLPA